MARLIRGASKNARFFIVDSKDVVQKAQDIHKCSPTAIAAFGRFLTAGIIMGAGLKGDDLMTLRTDTDGSLNHMVVTSDSMGRIKGYLSNPEAELPLKSNGQPNVGGIIGKGMLRVIKDMGLKEPYIGISNIQTGEIAEDIAYYYYTSEQTPTVLALGVSLNDDMSIKNAGGYMVQLLPDSEEQFIDKLEAKIGAIRPVTELFEGGMDLERIAKLLYEDMEDEQGEKLVEEYELYEEIETKYSCNCDKDRFYRGLMALGKEQLQDAFSEKESIEVECHFCKAKYEFKKEEFDSIMK
ncbi:Hsp33 family molecular chaperone HslO [uncultured Ilyobacter sp.]|jgi:molecular chaperone Hsp33|uniref:Hsp33 family molecular chaperone HslO n=1 Tax=uncultured Ilyobacter sp. TaxID=544433 RepID=UPI0029C066B7|nr:Hsp33 family molecular chaperone HslO [uncultured Ilyobacter sp.]